MLQCSTDNEKIKAVYGNYGLWSWLRYWHLDSPDFVLLMLLDKGYYDYDYEVENVSPASVAHEQSEERTQGMMDRFGFGKVKSIRKPPSPAELQAEVMAEEKKKGAAL